MVGVYAYFPTSHGRLQRGGGGHVGAMEDRARSGSEDGGGVEEVVGEAVDEVA